MKENESILKRSEQSLSALTDCYAAGGSRDQKELKETPVLSGCLKKGKKGKTGSKAAGADRGRPGQIEKEGFESEQESAFALSLKSRKKAERNACETVSLTQGEASAFCRWTPKKEAGKIAQKRPDRRYLQRMA